MPARARRSTWARLAVVAGVVMLPGLVSGCGARRSPGLAERFVRGADGPIRVDLDDGSAPAIAPGVSLPADAPVPKSSAGETIETASVPLREALAALARDVSPEALRRVATEYHRVGVFDRAESYLTRAIALDSDDPENYDARARVWRDWGVPERALSDAHRAAYLAPRSAAAKNTLGTVLFALGRTEAAAGAFRDALAIDPGAAWARNNLCYLSFLAGDEMAALEACSAAVAADAHLTAARNNLALVHAAAGRLDEAEREFAAAAPAAGLGHYNLGLVCLARGEFDRALRAFESAIKEAPALDAAFIRAQQTRRLAAAAEKQGGGK